MKPTHPSEITKATRSIVTFNMSDKTRERWCCQLLKQVPQPGPRITRFLHRYWAVEVEWGNFRSQAEADAKAAVLRRRYPNHI